MIAITRPGQIAPLAVSILFIVIIAVSVSLRLYARRLKNIPLQLDDYFILAATIFTYGLITCDIIGVTDGGVGIHAADIMAKEGPGPLTVFFKDLVAIQMLWSTSLMLMKLSILSFYQTLFGTHPLFRRASYIVASIIIMWWLSVVLCGFFLCRPFAFNWNQSILGGKCGDQVKSYIITGALNIATDVMVLALPLPVVWKLHAPLAHRLALMAIFTLGFFVCVISVLRMKSLLSVDYTDITYSVIDALIWSMLEPALGIALACAPIIRPVFKIFRERSTANVSGRSGASSDNHQHNLSSSVKSDSKNFQRLEEEGMYRLRPMGNERSYEIGYKRDGVDDLESHRTSRSEEELVPAVAARKIKVKSEWNVSQEPREGV